MSRIGGIINEMNNRTFIKERQINNRFIDLLNKQRIIVPPILDMYVKMSGFRKFVHIIYNSNVYFINSFGKSLVWYVVWNVSFSVVRCFFGLSYRHVFTLSHYIVAVVNTQRS